MNWFLLLIALLALAGWVHAVFKQRRTVEENQGLKREIDLIHKSIQTIGAGTFYYSIETDASYWDAKSKEIFGFPELSDPIPPGFWESRIYKDDRKRVISQAIKLLSDGGSTIMTHEYRIVLPTGGTRWVSGTAYLRRDHDGNIIESFGFHFDLTSQKNYEQELINERQKALQGMQAKTHFLTNMSHEIRTPMNAILGMIELLDDRTLGSVQSSYLNTLKNSGDVLMRIVNDILDLSKMEEGKLELESKPFNLREAVKQCLSVYTHASDQRDIFLGAYIDQRIPEVISGDSTRLQQALMNLIGNAFKFTSEGSIKLVITSLDSGGMRIEVTDTGIGINEQHLSKLFNRFEQGSTDITKNFGGSGLGLTIIKSIVELWQGRLGVESELGKGSTFWCELPFSEPLVDINRKANNSAILICSRFTELTSLWKLDDYAPNFEFADSALKFKELFANGQYDHVIVEQRAPGGNGPQLLDWVKTISPSTFTTLIGFEKYVGDSCDLPAVDRYCAKPYVVQELWSKEKFDGTDSSAFKLIQNLPSYHQISVLVVDDTQSNLIVIKGLLKRFSVKAKTCSSATESIVACKEQKFDLVLMDYEMPDMNGPDAAREILKTSQPKIVGLSAHVGAEFIDACLESGMSDFLSKPINTAELATLLEKYFSGSQPQ
jgi:signal transduction histidine kinase/CheY-like chemotaxis protein